ncbi:MAG: ATP-binding protein [Desulfobacteraceae bacterium]
MKELVILSGKGGTGKTSLTAAFAFFSKSMVLCDADVDAADLHLLMEPEVKEKHDFQGGNEAVINPDKCTECGLCMELCRFGAISEDPYKVDPMECEGCGVCYDLCPEGAIDFPLKTCGEWYISDTRYGPMVHARLGIAEENSGRLVALVREEARKIVQRDKTDLILTDGPPGIGCPVIASISRANAVLVVAEPSVSGVHDLKRVGELAEHFKIPAMVCVNKCDLDPDRTAAIREAAEENNYTYVGEIPFDKNFIESMIQKKSIIETGRDSDAGVAVKKIWENVMEHPAMKIERLV